MLPAALALLLALPAVRAAEPDKKTSDPFLPMKPSFKGARCPLGTHAVESPMGFRCVRGAPIGGAEEKRSLPGQAGAGTQNAPLQRLPPAAAAPPERALPDPLLDEKVLGPEAAGAGADDAPLVPKEFVPFETKGLALTVPRGWHLNDAWGDEVPTVYVEPAARRRGKPVTMLVSRVAPGQPGYESLAKAWAKEKEYQGAVAGPARKVSGLPCRQLIVDGESRTLYADAGSGAYYLLSYSAPKELFSLFEPAFEKLLASAKLGSR